MSKLEERQKLGPPQIGRRAAGFDNAATKPLNMAALEKAAVQIKRIVTRSETNIGTLPNKGTRKPGRPKSALTKAARQKAYREKKAGKP